MRRPQNLKGFYNKEAVDVDDSKQHETEEEEEEDSDEDDDDIGGVFGNVQDFNALKARGSATKLPEEEISTEKDREESDEAIEEMPPIAAKFE